MKVTVITQDYESTTVLEVNENDLVRFSSNFEFEFPFLDSDASFLFVQVSVVKAQLEAQVRKQ